MALRIGHEVRREVAAVELHALDRVERRLEALGLLDGDHAVLADLVHRVGDELADLGCRCWPRWCATCAMSFLPSTSLACFLSSTRRRLATAFSMPRLSAIGLAPAATFFMPSRKIAWASTVAVVVPSPARSVGLGGDFLDHLGAHVLEGVLELDLLGDRDAVLGDRRGAELLVEHDVAALGAERHLDGFGELIDAALQARRALRY
jgi:hypothetical protein